jgi:hypothetical protein
MWHGKSKVFAIDSVKLIGGGDARFPSMARMFANT